MGEKEKLSTRIKKKIIKAICVVDEVLDKASRPLMYFLELMGVIIAVIIMVYLLGGVKMMFAGKIAEGKEIVTTLGGALNSMKELLVGIFVALPTAIGTLKALTKKWKGGLTNGQSGEQNNG